jgi:hypothetical protein
VPRPGISEFLSSGRGLETAELVELGEAESASSASLAAPVPPGLPESSLRSEWQRVSVLCVESLSSFLIVNCQSVGLLWPVCSCAPSSVFSVLRLDLLCDCRLLASVTLCERHQGPVFVADSQ